MNPETNTRVTIHGSSQQYSSNAGHNSSHLHHHHHHHGSSDPRLHRPAIARGPSMNRNPLPNSQSNALIHSKSQRNATKAQKHNSAILNSGIVDDMNGPYTARTGMNGGNGANN